jgi:hypothetical protein
VRRAAVAGDVDLEHEIESALLQAHQPSLPFVRLHVLTNYEMGLRYGGAGFPGLTGLSPAAPRAQVRVMRIGTGLFYGCVLMGVVALGCSDDEALDDDGAGAGAGAGQCAAIESACSSESDCCDSASGIASCQQRPVDLEPVCCIKTGNPCTPQGYGCCSASCSSEGICVDF